MRTKNLIIGGLYLLFLAPVFTMTTKSQKPEQQVKSGTVLGDRETDSDSSLEATSNITLGHAPDTIRGYDIIEIGQGSTPRFSPDS